MTWDCYHADTHSLALFYFSLGNLVEQIFFFLKSYASEHDTT
jgi:hypothetical protein